ncbi:SH3 domain-containing protein [Marivirga sericea]|uniref:hypothetical protein n=1 Tax=Marivirga sericea TaxID=1028 RepID=UPI00111C28ED|nr:hypothetical protein [Marivirga sericea]
MYEKKQYISAIKIYEKIYNAGNTSPAMLLKLARIEEGMGNDGKSIYYLENYYQITKDEKVIDYLKKTSENKNTVGFDYGLTYKADLFYKDWKIHFQSFFSIIIIFGLGMMIKNRDSTHKKRNYFVLASLPLLVLGFLNNYEGKSEAIITETPSYLLEGPSSGANLVDKVTVPAKIQVNQEVDVWSKITFENKKAYIKTSQIKKL